MHNGFRCLCIRVNALLAAMAVANPVITALLTVVVFLEKDKIKKRSEDLEAALKAGNQELVQTVAAQKENFENIASRLEALSKDSAKSAETFVGLSTALTESSAVSATALNGVTTGLEEHSESVKDLVTNLSTNVSTTAKTSIESLATKSTESIDALSTKSTESIDALSTKSVSSLKAIEEEVKKVQTAQIAVADAVKELQETLKNTVSI